MAARSGIEPDLKGPKPYYDLRYPVIVETLRLVVFLFKYKGL